ncbi:MULTISPECIES: cytochrome P450 [unclassified Nocardioides]|uniref:cytochrome P450 n=1 Tax=unclassified Nocardioides TaxID=2615069 RepID=UPI001166FF72|nr:MULTISPECIES: cytochrome P450 [unclassified Nocardioides]TQK69251.1 cytochrome P450 [Nocardioides sp. SLBN-35]WGY01447.1 cytochrome P450 [Nocardioides sp. QY071]
MTMEAERAALDGDTRELTMRRFRHSTVLGGRNLPPVRPDRLPPGPRWPAFLQTVALMRFRHQFHPWLHRKYGDAYTVNLIPGNRPLVLFTRPEVTKEIFAADPEVFHAGKGNAILGPIMGEHSLLLQDGGEHHRARKLLMPAFLGHALRGYRGLVAEVAAAEVDTWSEDEPFRALERMNSLTLEVILRVVFGVTDEARLAKLRPAVNHTVEIHPAILLGWAYPRLQKLGPWRRTVDNQVELDRLMYAEIRERRAAHDLDERSDVLSRLLAAGDAEEGGLDDTELRDQLVTLLLAGHETTASALSWALVEVGRSPDLLARTQRAVDEGDDAWLEAVLKESMRLHPIIPMVVRTLMAPATVGGWDLPAGTTVGPSIIMSHQQESNFADPDVFRPERFLGDDVPALNVWIPFGGGVRRCIGAGFSLMEGVEVLREVFRRYDVTAVGTDVPKVRNITSVPRRGARIRVRAR